jgi:hypothetical protein
MKIAEVSELTLFPSASGAVTAALRERSVEVGIERSHE